ncbi:MAG: phage protease [Dechloromonas sp.]|nr:phage protease [Dechloromonas sp.]
MANRTHKTSYAALSVQFKTAGQAMQLLPAGEFRSTDGSGRPHDVPSWRMDGAIAARLMARLAAKANPLLIDYEHQTLEKEKNGQPAPAAGWFSGREVEWREGEGLFATAPAWNKRAAEMIGADEYKFISPVFEYDLVTGAVLDIQMVALTNHAGLTGMASVALTALNDFSTKEAPMPELLKKLLASLGMAETASEADVLSAVAAMKAKADSADGLTTQVAALKAQTPDPAKFVSVETMAQLQTQVAALTAQLNQGEVAQVVAAALDAGKLLPAQKDWAVDLGKTNLAALKAYVEKTPAIAALNGTQTNGKEPDGAKGVAAMTAEQKQVAAMLGLTADQFKQANPEA